MPTTVRTSLLILSDTHGLAFPADAYLNVHADIVIHCGDLSHESNLSEFDAALKLLRSLDAPLKLIIAGNHDFTLDPPSFKRIVNQYMPELDPELLVKEYGRSD